MNPRLLIRLDKFALPLAKVMQGVAKLSTIKQTEESRAGQRIVVLKFFGMGSIVRLSSILDKKQVDKSKILLCTFSDNKTLCEVLGYPNIGVVRPGLLYGIRDLVMLVRKINNFHPALLIDLERCSNLVSIFRIIVSTFVGVYGHSFNNRKKSRKSNIGMVHSLETTPIWDFVENFFNSDTANTLPQIQPVRIDSTKVIINSNASPYLIQRRYPPGQLMHTIALLHQWNPDLQFVFSGNSQEKSYVQGIVNELDAQGIKSSNCAGNWSLTDLISHLSECAIFITNDSGPMHLAAYLGVPTIAIWGPTHFRDFGYLQENGLVNISLEKGCSPCFRDPKSKVAKACRGTIECLTELKPSLVAGVAKEMLGSTQTMRNVKAPAGLHPGKENLLIRADG